MKTRGRTALIRRLGRSDKTWRLIDAKGQLLGRIATQAAMILQGKHKPLYEPSIFSGDPLIIINATQFSLSGKQWESKEYYRHSGYPGGLHKHQITSIIEKRPEKVLFWAIKGMLPKNKISRIALEEHLKIFTGTAHPYHAQQPVLLPPARDYPLKHFGLPPNKEEMEKIWDAISYQVSPDELEEAMAQVQRELKLTENEPKGLSLLLHTEPKSNGIKEAIRKYVQDYDSTLNPIIRPSY